MVKRLDEALGRMQDVLKSLKLDDNTIVCFTADHGSHFKTRNSEYKRSCHESCVHIPTAFWGPEFDAGGDRPEVVSLVDVPPTLLDAAGIDVPEAMQGRSIMPLIRRQSDAWRDEAFIQISESQVGRALRTRKWKYAVTAPDANGKTEGTASRYVEDALYDLDADPYELTNLVDQKSHADVCARLRKRLLSRMVEAGEEQPVIEPFERRPSGQRIVLEEEVTE
jgi:arylsulfatase A-like enzyme